MGILLCKHKIATCFYSKNLRFLKRYQTLPLLYHSLCKPLLHLTRLPLFSHLMIFLPCLHWVLFLTQSTRKHCSYGSFIGVPEP